MSDELQLIATAVKAARADAKGKGVTRGHVDCPRCGGALAYSIRSNPLAHPEAPTVWGACSAPDCLAWMM